MWNTFPHIQTIKWFFPPHSQSESNFSLVCGVTPFPHFLLPLCCQMNVSQEALKFWDRGEIESWKQSEPRQGEAVFSLSLVGTLSGMNEPCSPSLASALPPAGHRVSPTLWQGHFISMVHGLALSRTPLPLGRSMWPMQALYIWCDTLLWRNLSPVCLRPFLPGLSKLGGLVLRGWCPKMEGAWVLTRGSPCQKDPASPQGVSLDWEVRFIALSHLGIEICLSHQLSDKYPSWSPSFGLLYHPQAKRSKEKLSQQFWNLQNQHRAWQICQGHVDGNTDNSFCSMPLTSYMTLGKLHNLCASVSTPVK